MQPFVLYSLSGLAIAVFFVATIFNDPQPKTAVRLVRYSQAGTRRRTSPAPRDPVDLAVNVTQVSENENH